MKQPYLAPVPLEPNRTDTPIIGNQVHAIPSIETRVAGTLIDVGLALSSSEPRLARAVVVIDQVYAGRPVQALAETVVEVLVAVLAAPAGKTRALVVADQVAAPLGVHARVDRAFVGVWKMNERFI